MYRDQSASTLSLTDQFGRSHKGWIKYWSYKLDFKSVKLQDCPIYYLKNMSCFYQGIWKEQLPHGCGIAVYKNNSYYEG